MAEGLLHRAYLGKRGYLKHQDCTVAQPYVTFSIDTTGSIDPILFFNY